MRKGEAKEILVDIGLSLGHTDLEMSHIVHKIVCEEWIDTKEALMLWTQHGGPERVKIPFLLELELKKRFLSGRNSPMDVEASSPKDYTA